MRICFAEPSDKNEVMAIWNYCFGDPKEYTDYYFKSRYKPENTVVAKDSDGIASALQLNPHRISLGGKLYDTSYIVGVSTLPQYRGLGIVRNLFAFAFNELFKRGELVSVLMPIDYSIYRKFGYEAVCEQYLYELDIDMLSGFKPVRRFRLAGRSETEFVELSDIYASFTSGKNLFTLRDASYYKELHDEVSLDKGGIVLADGGSGPDGYMVYTIEGDSMMIREIAYNNIDALKSMLGYAYSHKTQVSKVIVQTFKDDYIYRLLPNIRNIKLSLKPFLMGRVINLKGYLKSIHSDKPFATFVLEVQDEMLPVNSGRFKVSHVPDGSIRIEDADPTEAADASMDITALSQLAFGHIDPQELCFMNKIKCADRRTLDSLSCIFSVGINYFNEYV